MTERDEEWMHVALARAAAAGAAGEVPVGAVVVVEGRLVGEGANEMEASRDPRRHAECVALDAARVLLGTARLSEATLYVTLEPCAQCAGAIILTRISRVVFGAFDPRLGALGSRWSILDDNPLGEVRVRGGVLEAECQRLLQDWFKRRRASISPA